MYTFDYTITDPIGIHARPAGLLAREAAKYTGKIWLVKNGKKAEMRRMIAIMGLGVKAGETVRVEIEGEQEAEMGAQIEAFFKENL